MTMNSSASTPGTPDRSASGLAVIVCDDHFAIRAGVIKILEQQAIHVIGECSTVASLVELVQQYPDAVIIMDLGMGEIPLRELVATLHEQSPACKVVVYSMREAPSTIGLCYEAGALAFVPKRADPEELIKAITHAHQGERYFPASVASELANLHVDGNAPANVLSSREMEIFIAYAKREGVDALAARLGISDRSVHNTLSRIAKKLDVPRSTFTDIARRYGLIDIQ